MNELQPYDARHDAEFSHVITTEYADQWSVHTKYCRRCKALVRFVPGRRAAPLSIFTRRAHPGCTKRKAYRR